MTRLQLIRLFPSGSVYVTDGSRMTIELHHSEWLDPDTQQPREDWAELSWNLDDDFDPSSEYVVLATAEL